MSRHTTKKEVLQRVKTVLENSHPLYKHRVFVMTGADLPPAIKDNDLITVSFAGGNYSHSEQMGAGMFAVPYEGTVRVCVWHIDRTDRQGAEHNLLLADNTGMFTLQAKILMAMLDTANSLLPGDGDYDPILSSRIHVISDSDVQRAEGVFGKTPSGDMAQAYMTIDFGVDFHWDLGQE